MSTNAHVRMRRCRGTGVTNETRGLLNRCKDVRIFIGANRTLASKQVLSYAVVSHWRSWGRTRPNGDVVRDINGLPLGYLLEVLALFVEEEG